MQLLSPAMGSILSPVQMIDQSQLLISKRDQCSAESKKPIKVKQIQFFFQDFFHLMRLYLIMIMFLMRIRICDDC